MMIIMTKGITTYWSSPKPPPQPLPDPTHRILKASVKCTLWVCFIYRSLLFSHRHIFFSFWFISGLKGLMKFWDGYKIKIWSHIFINQLHFAGIYFPLKYFSIFTLKSGNTMRFEFCVVSFSVHLIFTDKIDESYEASKSQSRWRKEKKLINHTQLDYHDLQVGLSL